ncbi:MAG: phospho-sugar mutase [Bacilli bacterium]|jgi:phosphoglucomutase
MDMRPIVDHWKKSRFLPPDLKEQLEAYRPDELLDAFYKDIEFGTAGMRGIMGPGPNRINIFTIKKATIGFGLYLLGVDESAREHGVVIAHDNRRHAREFNDLIAATLSQMGFKVYIFEDLRPTPELSFAVREKGAAGGIVITASHNPKQYNGYKVYDETGCQLTPNRIAPLVETIASLPDSLEVEIPAWATPGEIVTLGNELDFRYLYNVKGVALYPDLPKRGFKVVYSPEHGTGSFLGVRLLRECGYELYPVVSQCVPDPDFSQTKSPNPELDEAYEEAIKLAKTIQAQLVLVTDPDADRVGVAYRDEKGNYVRLTGNQSGALLIDYLLRERNRLGRLADNGVVYDTIVTSPLGAKVAEYHGCRVESFLTGFKFIGDRIHFYEKTGGPHFEFGYEESYGCLIAPFSRDKDGFQAILMYAEMALFYHLQGYHLGQRLHILHKRHGFYVDRQVSKDFQGPTGAEKIATMLARLRKTPFAQIGDFKVATFEDYLTSIRKSERQQTSIALPSSDVVKFILTDGSSIAVRPSGTEPKCKLYFSAVASSSNEADAKMNKLIEAFLTTYDL